MHRLPFQFPGSAHTPKLCNAVDLHWPPENWFPNTVTNTARSNWMTKILGFGAVSVIPHRHVLKQRNKRSLEVLAIALVYKRECISSLVHPRVVCGHHCYMPWMSFLISLVISLRSLV